MLADFGRLQATYGRARQITPQWTARYAEEMRVVVDQEWINANGTNTGGINLVTLGEAFDAITGDPTCFQVPPRPLSVACSSG